MTHTKSNCEITLSLVFFLQRQTLQNVLFPLDANEGATQTTPIRAAREGLIHLEHTALNAFH